MQKKVKKHTERILIIDSGSTKSDWMYGNLIENQANIMSSAGLNPVVSDMSILEIHIKKTLKEIPDTHTIDNVYFFGAGCGTEESKEIIRRIFLSSLPEAEIQVYEDITGAALSIAGDNPAYICILGTGSNACYWDGSHAHVPQASLGYIIMDEGSGNYFGKALLRDYFYKRLPEVLQHEMEQRFDMRIDKVKAHLYRGDFPNAYLGEIAKLMSNHTGLSYVNELLSSGFQLFVDNWVLPHLSQPDLPVHFVGSVAYYYEGILRKVLKKNELSIGRVLSRPIDGLWEYYRKQI